MAGKKKGKLSYEESILEIERLIAMMQEDSLPLEEMMQAYEKGSKLIGELETMLAGQRRRLEQIDMETGEISPISSEMTE